MEQRGVQRYEVHGVVAAAQTSVEGELVSGRENFSIGSVSTLTGVSVVGWISYFSVTKLQCSGIMQ